MRASAFQSSILPQHLKNERGKRQLLGTRSGMVMRFDELHESKAYSSIAVTDGRMTASKEVQRQKALLCILVTEFRMLALSKDMQP